MTWPGHAAFTLLLLGGAAWLLAETLMLGAAARLAPIWVIAPTCVLLAIVFVRDIRHGLGGSGSPVPAQAEQRSGEVSALLWLAALVIAVLLFGLMVAVPLFFLFQVRLVWKQPRWIAAAIGVAAFAVLYLLFTVSLGIYLPPGWMWPD